MFYSFLARFIFRFCYLFFVRSLPYYSLCIGFVFFSIPHFEDVCVCLLLITFPPFHRTQYANKENSWKTALSGDRDYTFRIFFPSHNRKMIFIFVSIANFFENYFIIYFILAFYSGNGKNSSFVCVTVCFSFTFLIHFRAGNGWAYAFSTRLFEYLSVSVYLQCVFLFIYGNRNRLEALFLFWANATGNSNPNIIKHCKHFFVQRIGTAKLITLLDKRHGNEKFAIRWRKTWERKKSNLFNILRSMQCDTFNFLEKRIPENCMGNMIFDGIAFCSLHIHFAERRIDTK